MILLDQKYQELKNRLREIYDLQSVMSMLSWDQNTYLPQAGFKSRSNQLALLGKIIHEKETDPALGQLIEDLVPWADKLSYDSDEASLIRLVHREYQKAIRVPPSFISQFHEHIAQTYEAWARAREENDFTKVAPYVEKSLELSRTYANYFPGYEHIADPLINESDYGMKAHQIRQIFGELRDQLVPLVDQITSQSLTDSSPLLQHYPKEQQLAFSQYVIKKLGLSPQRSRLDLTIHPFMIRISGDDIRITTQVKEDDLSFCLFSVIHEAGHALYELGIHPPYDGTPFYDGTSSGVHESQSRLWENVIGRSRGFWEHFYPRLQQYFPSQLNHVSLEQFYLAINHVERSPIRIEADEVTYNLHVIIRFDLELALLEGKLEVKDLPEAWRYRYQSDLGITPSCDLEGVLQDVHWYSGMIGGAFQGYTIGNILSAQFYESALKAHSEIPNQIKQGNFETLHNWLVDHIYRYGSKYTAEEIILKATGSSLTIQPYLYYLRKKFGEIYSLN
ncbi:carboxypeptidase [Thermoflavimicrobium daqui]|uniref:Metal-dependent carboxypeptidase n=1 Tax=Thermoflavimicrobium daqui TaxID=2137476 RepID=A0A364K4U1_9BACL|nr:carboxypeptidase M32 [Thermoflavimicrobium daqui]RAL24385.1 carboxypeptidase [Thermoflavimicrobium daqui]